MNTHEWKATAQLFFKVSCGLLAAVIVLAVVAGVLAFRNSKKTEQYNQLHSAMLDQLARNTQLEQALQAKEEPQPEQPQEHILKQNTAVSVEYIGDYKLTYYCSCEKCCGEWGKDRPVVNNKKVVFTATGAFAQEGITIAVDPTKIPYGTLVYIEGVGYRIAQDCGGAIKGNRIDVYMNSHADALQQGVREAKVYIIEGGTTNEEK